MVRKTRFSFINNTGGKIGKKGSASLSRTPDRFVKVSLALKFIGKLIQQLNPVCITVLNQSW